MKQIGTPERDGLRTTHQSLERGLRILETVSAFSGASSLAETARRTGLHRSTTHHLLQALVAMGYLHQDPTTRGYEPAAKLFRLTGRTWTPEQMGEIAQPFLAELGRRCQEGTSFAVYRDGIVTIAAKRDADSPVRVVQDVGARRPIYATAVGKAILPWLSPDEISSLLDGVEFEPMTPRTLVSREALMTEMERIRTHGCAIDDEEHILGIRCIAAPVFGYAGHVVGSLCALGPKSRMTRQKLRGLRGPVTELAGTLSERFGWQPKGA